MDDPSFSVRVKNELAHLFPELECCRRTELAALLRATGRIEIGSSNQVGCSFSTDYPSVARKIIRLVKSCYGLKTVTMVMRRRRLRKNLTYLVRLRPQPGLPEMLTATGVMDGRGWLLEWGELDALAQDHCRRAYLRGTFMGNGWVSPPGRQHHLEMTTTATEAADALGQMLFGYGIPIRMAVRKELLVLYLKDADHIARFLSVSGAHQSLMRFEDVRAMKVMKNLVNRQVNAETANLNKSVEAAARQVEVIERLRQDGSLQRLSRPLRELAQLRLNHPDVSLKELGEMCTPRVTKSAVNHRMRQLMQIASTEE